MQLACELFSEGCMLSVGCKEPPLGSFRKYLYLRISDKILAKKKDFINGKIVLVGESL